MSMRWENRLDLGRLSRAIDVGGDEGLILAAEYVRGVADEDTPVESGRLVGSGTPTGEHPAEVHHTATGAEVGILYEGPYAAYQHEGLVRHGSGDDVRYGPKTLHHEHGESKWLEKALATEAGTALDIVARRIQDAL